MRSMCLRFDSEADLNAHMRRPHAVEAPRAVRPGTTPERDVLDGVLSLLTLSPVIAWARRMTTGCGYVIDAKTFKRLVDGGHLKTNDARFLRFGFPGCSDVLGMTRRGRLVAVETKSSVGRLTDEQAAFLDAVNAGGGLGVCARSIDDVVRALAV